MLRKIIIAALVVTGMGIGGWYLYVRYVSRTPIGQIVENPRAYESGILTIEGKVTGRTSFLFVKFFTLKDKTGEIRVVTKRTLPLVGSWVSVRGRTKEGFSIGNLQTLVFVEEKGKF